MITCCINNVFPVIGVNPCNFQFAGIAYDGKYFIMTDANRNKIYKLDKCFELRYEIDVCREYRSICFDIKEDCYWAVGACGNNIYKLSPCFTEIDKIEMNSMTYKYGKITGITCGDRHHLIITFCNVVLEVNKNSASDIKVIYKKYYGLFNSIVRTSFCYLLSFVNKDVNYILGYNENDRIEFECCLPLEYTIVDTTYFGINCYIDDVVYILALKQNLYPYIFKICIREVMPNNDDCCDFLQIQNIEDKCCQSNSSQDIIESIALIEKALSNILNAEGDKIKKILSCTNNPYDIIKVNESVNKTIKNIAHLENILMYKLQIAKEIYNENNGGCNDNSCFNNECCNDVETQNKIYLD